METKQHIRKKIFEYRKKLSTQDVVTHSHLIFQKIIEQPEYQEATCIYAYMDFNKEVMTRELIEHAWSQGKMVAVPKVTGQDMEFYILEDFKQLQPGYFQIPEPTYGELADFSNVLLIVPGVAFDKQRHRVGYGKGFYDRFLEKHPDFHTIAVGFDFQMVDEVPCESTDILPQKLITQSLMIE